jgi:hypothetical protein
LENIPSPSKSKSCAGSQACPRWKRHPKSIKSRSRGLAFSGGGSAGLDPVTAATVTGIAAAALVKPAETATPLFNTSRLVHLRIAPPYSERSLDPQVGTSHQRRVLYAAANDCNWQMSNGQPFEFCHLPFAI